MTELPAHMASLAATLLLLGSVFSSSRAAPLGPSAVGSFHPVGEQELTYPSRVDEHGHHLSFQLHGTTRSQEDRLFFKVEAFEEIFFLNVTANSQFVSDNLLVEYVSENGSTIEQPKETGCFHSGHISGKRGEGWAAVSNCQGLYGVMATSSGYYFIEPLENDTPLSSSGWKHAVYKHTQAPRKGHSCTASAETDKPETPSTNLTPTSNSGKTKRSVVTEQFVETAIVADKSMLQHHGRKKLESYLFSLMNVVSHLYRDPTIGHAVSIVLVRTVILETDQFKVSRNAQMSLHNFCAWQKTLNEQGLTHHDVAVLVTRKSICETSGNNCGILGMAELKGACDPKKSCNINKDSGLSTAFTIAHEIGHNLGMRHDGDPTASCQAKTKYLMAPSFATSSNPHHWSHCSRQQLAQFLDSPNSACLGNCPSDYTESSGNDSLPGMVHSPTEQCHLLHGNTSSHCPGMTDECRWLWCRVEGGECSHRHSPPAPGTPCTLQQGEAGVCYQGVCVEQSMVVERVDGGWGEWGEWGHCSHSCGTGVQSSTRECNSPTPANGGQYCLGLRQRYRTCSTLKCPTPTDVRQQLCESSNSNWEAPSFEFLILNRLDTCKQHCRLVGTNNIFTMMAPLPDGTPCSTGSPGLCLKGKCVPVGCDYQLNVTAQRDHCGVWCGDGSSCIQFSGTYSIREHSVRKHKYYKAATIPEGAANVLVAELQLSQNAYIAAGSSTESINFNYRIAWPPMDLWLAGTVWRYERPNGSPEFLRTDDVIRDNVTVYLLTNEITEGIRYSFSLPKETASSWRPVGGPVYYWNSTEWEDCDTGCESVQERGVGCVEEREVACVEVREDGGRGETNESYCNGIVKPPVMRVYPQCQYEWRSTEWSECSAACGEGTVRREVNCTAVREGATTRVNERFCGETTKPVTVQSCFMEPCRYNWRVGEWGECDVVCGEGWMKRDVVCLSLNHQVKDGEQGATVGDSHCGGSKPADSISCQAESCERFQWVASKWTECDVACGEGSQNRSISCRHQNGTTFPPQFCSQHTTPESTQTCTGHNCPTTTPPPTTEPPTTTPSPTTEPPTTTPSPTTEPPTTTPSPTTEPPTTTPSPTTEPPTTTPSPTTEPPTTTPSPTTKPPTTTPSPTTEPPTTTPSPTTEPPTITPSPTTEPPTTTPSPTTEPPTTTPSPTTPPPPVSCQEELFGSLCRTVVRHNFCWLYRKKCCRSCAR